MANHKASMLPLNKLFAIKYPLFYKCEGLDSICGAELLCLFAAECQIGSCGSWVGVTGFTCNHYCSVVKLLVVQLLLGTRILHSSKAAENHQ